MTKIEVTQEDINNGKVGDCEYCPVALAMNRVTNKEWAIGNYSYCETRDGEINSDSLRTLPREVTLWIFQFDKDNKVEPFSFELPI